jgi:hypothetical protein
VGIVLGVPHLFGVVFEDVTVRGKIPAEAGYTNIVSVSALLEATTM